MADNWKGSYLRWKKGEARIEAGDKEVRIPNKDAGVFEQRNYVSVVNPSPDKVMGFDLNDNVLGVNTKKDRIHLAPRTKYRVAGNVGFGTPDIILNQLAFADVKSYTGTLDGRPVTGWEDVHEALMDNKWLLFGVVIGIATLIVVALWWKAGARTAARAASPAAQPVVAVVPAGAEVKVVKPEEPPQTAGERAAHDVVGAAEKAVGAVVGAAKRVAGVAEDAVTGKDPPGDNPGPAAERRPPKEFMDRCISDVSTKGGVSDPGAVCAAQWHRMDSAARAPWEAKRATREAKA